MTHLADLMTPDPLTVTPDTCLLEVLSLLHNACCRQVPVVDEAGRLVGIITDRDLRLAVNASALPLDLGRHLAALENLTAVACMTPDPVTVDIDTPFYEAAEMLARRKVGALPVLEGGELVGIVTTTDFLNFIAAEYRPDIAAIP